mmetsp:Transcript_81052/g.251536  ORF Transcript_81052/g.251536 Transcript_81052/m.251536 type:complete len:81 (-) Transcript_81052:620-862(-)
MCAGRGGATFCEWELQHRWFSKLSCSSWRHKQRKSSLQRAHGTCTVLCAVRWRQRSQPRQQLLCAKAKALLEEGYADAKI